MYRHKIFRSEEVTPKLDGLNSSMNIFKSLDETTHQQINAHQQRRSYTFTHVGSETKQMISFKVSKPDVCEQWIWTNTIRNLSTEHSSIPIFRCDQQTIKVMDWEEEVRTQITHVINKMMMDLEMKLKSAVSHNPSKKNLHKSHCVSSTPTNRRVLVQHCDGNTPKPDELLKRWICEWLPYKCFAKP